MFTHDNLDQIIGADLVDVNGDRVGSIGHVFLDDDTNQPSWVTVNTGFFGMNETFIPIQGANLDGDVVRVQYEKGFIKDAPNVDVDNGHLSREEEAELYRYYDLQDGDRTRTDAAAAGLGTNVDRDRDLDVDRDRRDGTLGDNVGNQDMTAVAHEERLNVGTEQVETGRARLRKYTTTEQETVQVPVQKERLVVERENVDGRPVAGGLDQVDRTDDFEQDVTLHEERPVIDKETVESERVHLGTETVTEDQTVTGQVEQEHIDVEGAGDRGDLGGDRDRLGTDHRDNLDLNRDGRDDLGRDRLDTDRDNLDLNRDGRDDLGRGRRDDLGDAPRI